MLVDFSDIYVDLPPPDAEYRIGRGEVERELAWGKVAPSSKKKEVIVFVDHSRL